MFEATNYISEYNVGDKFISFQYTNGKRFAQINVCQNKKVERNKKKIEVYQEGNAPLSLSFSTEDEAIEAFDLLNTTLDTLRTNCQTANAVVTLFPNGQEIVTESRDFRDSDIDKLLIVIGNDITLTMPDSIVFSEQGRTIGLKFLQGYTGCGYQAAHGFTTKVLQLPNDGEFITLITGEYLGKSSVCSIANMQVNSDGEIVTLNKYLYDKVNASGGGGSYIPLSGTASGSPVTGDIEVGGGIDQFYLGLNDILDAGLNSKFFIDGSTVGIYNETIGNYKSSFSVNSDIGATFDCNNPTSRGIIGAQDFTSNITDLDYTQKKYVDSVIAAIKPYKVYTAIITQTGTDAPTAVVLQNTLGITPTLTRFATGNYRITASNTFTANKTFCIVGQEANSGTGMNYIWASDSNDDEVLLQTYDGAGLGAALTDDKMDRLAVEIRVYK